MACRGDCLAAPESLPLVRPCRDAWCAAASFSWGALGRSSRRAPPAGALVLRLGRPGKLLLPGPRLLGPASSSCRGLVFLAWMLGLHSALKGAVETLGAPLASLAAGCYNCPCTSSGY